MPRANYFPKLEKLDTSLYMLGWGGASTDPIFILQPVLHGANSKGDGDYNYGRYTNAKLDTLVDQVKTEIDVEKRRKLINEALMIQHDELLHLPLHRQVIPWATRSTVSAVHRADNWVLPYWVKVNNAAP
jgi:peptide/nickel transport system substrate-binding protein